MAQTDLPLPGTFSGEAATAGPSSAPRAEQAAYPHAVPPLPLTLSLPLVYWALAAAANLCSPRLPVTTALALADATAKQETFALGG
jgi:hypothetical protein